MKNIKKGISLIVLIITIIVMIILAAVTINIATSGIIENARNAKYTAEVASEKQVVQIARTTAASTSQMGKVTLENMQKAINEVSSADAATVIGDDETLIVKFNESERCYEIDGDGNIAGPKELIKDEYAGEITKGGRRDGSAERPYEINCIEDLVAFSIMTNGGNTELALSSNTFTDKYVKIVRTLDFNSIFSYDDYATTIYGDLNADGTVESIKAELTKTKEGCVGFTPINNFQGYFDGQGNELQNIYIKREGPAALFTTTPKSVKNVGVTGKITSTTSEAAGITIGGTTIENCWNKANITAGSLGAAGICANGGNIKNCYNTGNITNMSPHDIGYGVAGGISTYCGSTIENCYNTGDITGNGYVGGISSGHGNGTTTVKNCYNTGNINGGSSAGGILGCNGGTIENCYNTGNVSGSQYSGGIVGTIANEITNCYNTGTIKGNAIGGISYKLGEIIVNCYNLGLINGVCGGGIVGFNETSGAVISNCFNIGDILPTYWSYYGGILGQNTKDVIINNSYSVGDMLGENAFGAIVGSNIGTEVTINKCYYLKTERVNQAVNGVEDNTLDVEQYTSIGEITADKLNANISTIEHDEEWREWIQGEEYPIFK